MYRCIHHLSSLFYLISFGLVWFASVRFGLVWFAFVWFKVLIQLKNTGRLPLKSISVVYFGWFLSTFVFKRRDFNWNSFKRNRFL